MTWTYTPYAGILHATAVISAFVGFMVLRRRNTSGVRPLAFLMFAIAEWAFTSGLEAAVIGIQYKVFWSKIEYLGAVCAPTLFLVFALEYSQKTRWLKPVYLVLLSVVPLIIFFFTTTNELHGLIWTSFTPSLTQPNVVIYGHGIGYYILIAYDYLIVSVGIGVLLRTWVHAKPPYRRQAGTLLLGSLFPFVGGIVYTFVPDFLTGLDLTPVSFSLTGLVIAFGILRFQLFDLTPIARDVLIKNMDEGILVLDAQDRVVDFNPAAQSILGTIAKKTWGSPLPKYLSPGRE